MYVKQRRSNLEQFNQRLVNAEHLKINHCKQLYLTNAAKLDAMSPLKVLTRGYALVQNSESEIIRSVKQVNPGDKLCVALSDGSIRVTAE